MQLNGRMKTAEEDGVHANGFQLMLQVDRTKAVAMHESTNNANPTGNM